MNDEYLTLIESALKRIMLKYGGWFPSKLLMAAEYALFSGGKRIRPYLCLLSADFVQIEKEKILPLAASLELIHTYSLIHDDLPAMDNDDFRRGKPSCHKAFGEAIAILAGDALLNLAYENLLDAVAADSSLIPAAVYLARCAGGAGMAGGQALEFSGVKLDIKSIVGLYMKKTGALIRAAILMPALIAGDAEKRASLDAYAEAVGLAFQLRDDVSDEKKREENTYLSLMGREKTLSAAEDLRLTARNALAKWKSAAPLSDFCDMLTI